ncbi:MAG: T9SS type A sorting domain-containing protein [Saprospiraceae bacterium]
MQILNKVFIILLLPILCCVSCLHDETPLPTGGETEINLDAEDATNKYKRESWFKLLHQCEPGTDWKALELANTITNNAIIQGLRKKQTGSRNDNEILAGGNILGKWYERGSSNQAGNVIATSYDIKKDEIFLVSGGGSIFKGNRSGIGWEVVNHNFRFSNNLMEIIHLPNNQRRLIAAINNTPYFSDDEGNTWDEAKNIPGFGDGQIYHPSVTSSQKICLLQKRSYWNPVKLFISEDHGVTYQEVFNFVTNDHRNVAMNMDETTGDMYIISQQDVDLSTIYRYKPNDKIWEILTTDSNLGFGEKGTANIKVINTNGIIRLFSYDGNQRLHVSNDFGNTWTFLSTLPSEPWSVGLFISPSNPNHMIYGEVDAFRSRDGGKTWQKINGWWEYYNNVASKLHADIMALKEYEDEDGNRFILISNHGGLSITFDGGVTNDNIGLFDLNVSQYYDVKSYPHDPNFVFAGAQDQGFQKGFIPGNNPESLVQVISGDYGHIAFTENGLRLWTVYPGGWVTYYPNPRSEGNVASYEVVSEEESVWIPPITASPIPAENSVYMAGGNINGGKGSHLIKLTYHNVDNSIKANQFSYNFKTSGGELSAIAFSPFNQKKIYCATTNGKMYVSLNGGDQFTYSALNLPGSQYLYGSHILPSSLDSNLVYISGSGYSNSGVMVSKNGGKTFTALNNGLPKTMIFKIVFNDDETLMYAATEAGPYVYIKNLDKWFYLGGTNTPNQTFWSVEYLPTLQIARFGTYGRGIWDFQFKENIITSEKNIASPPSFSIYPNPCKNFIYVELTSPDMSQNLISVFDIRGNNIQVPVEKMGSGLYKLSIEHLNPGLYFISQHIRKSKQIQKFIKL